MGLLGFFSLLEGLGVNHNGVEVDSCELASIEHVDKHVEEGDAVVSAACLLEVKLVKTSENHVSSESFNFLFFDMLPR